MNAIRLHTRGGPKALVYEQAATPRPGARSGGIVRARRLSRGTMRNIRQNRSWGSTYRNHG